MSIRHRRLIELNMSEAELTAQLAEAERRIAACQAVLDIPNVHYDRSWTAQRNLWLAEDHRREALEALAALEQSDPA